MTEVTQRLLSDLLAVTGIAMVIGLMVYALLGRMLPTQSWHRQGEVFVSPFQTKDLFLALALFSLMSWDLIQIWFQGVPPSLAASPLSNPEGGGASAVMILISLWNQFFVCGLILLYLRYVRGLHLPEIFGLRHYSVPAAFGIAVLALIGTYALLMLVSYVWKDHFLKEFWPEGNVQEVVKTYLTTPSLWVKFLIACSAVFAAPLIEEILFRGLLYGALKRFTDIPFAAVLSSLMFAIAHHNVPAVVPLFALALGLCLAYEWSGSLWVPFFMHLGFNSINLMMMPYVQGS